MQLGLTFVLRAFGHVWGNLGAAARIVFWPFAVCLALELWQTSQEIADPEGIASVWAIAAVILGSSGMVSVIAVSWHRLILLDEKPRPLAVLRRGGVLWHYFARWFVIGLVITLALTTIGGAIYFVLSLFFSLNDTFVRFYRTLRTAIFPMPILFVVGIPLIWAFLYPLFRYGQVLPHTAIEGEEMDVKTAWKMTQPIAFPVCVTSGIAAVLNALALYIPWIIYEHVIWPLEAMSFAARQYAFATLDLIFYTGIVLIGAALLTAIYQVVREDVASSAPRGAGGKDIAG